MFANTYNNLSCDIFCKYLQILSNVLWGYAISQIEKSKYRYINIDIDILNWRYDFLNIYYTATFYLVYSLLYLLYFVRHTYLWLLCLHEFFHLLQWIIHFIFYNFPFPYLFVRVCVCESMCVHVYNKTYTSKFYDFFANCFNCLCDIVEHL